MSDQIETELKNEYRRKSVAFRVLIFIMMRADGIEALGLMPQSSVSEIGILISNTIAVEIKNNLFTILI
ncbi:MAG: hypothetical protein ACTSRP_21375 [Candidatus Helarchaeota archaeon]